jgi:hypothetical protein
MRESSFAPSRRSFLSLLGVGVTAAVTGQLTGLPGSLPAASAAVPPPGPGFLVRKGSTLLLNGAPFIPFFGSINGETTASQTVAAAQALGLNAVRLTDWLDVHGVLGTAERSNARWKLVDANIAALAAAGIKVILDLSCFRNMLVQNNLDPYSFDWTAFLSFVLYRTNTVSGLQYKNDPAISIVEFAGEVAAPNFGTNPPTAAELVTFYDTVSRFWKSKAPYHLCCPGGFLFLDYADQAGIPVAEIAALAEIDMVSIHTYGDGDLNVGVPYLSGVAAAVNKPWLNEEFGAALGGDITEDTRAAYFNNHYAVDSANQCGGEGFWNMSNTPAAVQSSDIGWTGATSDAIRARAAALSV